MGVQVYGAAWSGITGPNGIDYLITVQGVQGADGGGSGGGGTQGPQGNQGYTGGGTQGPQGPAGGGSVAGRGWATTSTASAGLVIPTELTSATFVYEDPGYRAGAPKSGWIPSEEGIWSFLPVIVDRNGRLAVAIPASMATEFAQYFDEDKWVEMPIK